ncbi:hypothetical protein H257_18886 [Aphanomyces astaci]|uniref:Uncharacterized protein n=1 Tax=Aphanomyces astaci TaxID=112090 RepID=W4F9Q3_APHAT|nr:hypothetical protein H257_18886 [Aphanomyces astaci]ETV64187.1 hypothetical protein H257_18886 [Aphanomyces astaci]|eukprot:XP_009846325.1 hypothetical protein H257_18886 [Aphanomyces astaci]
MEAFENLAPSSIKGCIDKADRQLYKLAEYIKGLQEVEASDNESVEGSSDGGSVTSSTLAAVNTRLTSCPAQSIV